MANGTDPYGGYGDVQPNAPATASTVAMPSAATATPTATTAPFPGWVDPSNTNPEQLAANLISAQFQEWQQSFMPIELNALQQVSLNNPQVLTNAVATANQQARGNVAAMSGIAARQNRALGITPNAQQSAASNRILNLTGALDVAGAQNQARGVQRYLDESILLGSAPSPQIVNQSNTPSSITM